jgi:hypothetical protein
MMDGFGRGFMILLEKLVASSPVEESGGGVEEGLK